VVLSSSEMSMVHTDHSDGQHFMVRIAFYGDPRLTKFSSGGISYAAL
jgi:hypothetical protein